MSANAFFLAALLLASAALAAANHHGMHGDDNEQQNNSTDDDLYNPRDALLKYLHRQASPRVPPPPRYLPVKVQVKLRPLSIRSVCPKTYHIEMPTLEMYNWTDPRLAWNSSDFGGVEYIDISAKDIWMPDIAVWQSPESTPMQTRPKEYKAVVTSDGAVLYIPISELSIHCDASPWKQHDKKHNSGSSSSGRSKKTKSTSPRQVADNETDSDSWTQDESNYKTYDCEFDQGPWIYDMSIVNVIPVSTGTAFHEHTDDGNETSSANTSNENEDPSPQENEESEEQTDSHGNQIVKQKQNFAADDFDATADLSWFDGNELYDIASFTAERLVERYTSFPVDWSSIHYHLVVKINNNKKWGKPSKKSSSRLGSLGRGGTSGRRAAAAAVRQDRQKEQENSDTDDDDDKSKEEEQDD